ncbi:hypothetical protein MetMK1DRAFT_00013020 [Metallosphaera yellowstonensis MK1]|uniref:Uncharacterized protein n=1 Tax=Metallosphaera yellowstonensis MK1 TaxID=671065 RepID=H2C3H8_9CREN|nr:hypothetical protein [Metallosphaera yellowstonensis]EHP70799.1 hypothetical protein MetMK1DRAFT_00013020 [Metallosphaera yellowstonensis MK1]
MFHVASGKRNYVSLVMALLWAMIDSRVQATALCTPCHVKECEGLGKRYFFSTYLDDRGEDILTTWDR